MALQPRCGVRGAGSVGGEDRGADPEPQVFFLDLCAPDGADGGERRDGGRGAHLAGVHDDV